MFKDRIKNIIEIFLNTPTAMRLALEASRPLTCYLFIIAILFGFFPLAIAYFTQLLIDEVALSQQAAITEKIYNYESALFLLAIEALLVISMLVLQRVKSGMQSLLKARLGNHVNVMILGHTSKLTLEQFETPKVNDLITKVRIDASERPYNLVIDTISLIQNTILILSIAGVVISLSYWFVLVIIISAIPLFLSETHFSNQGFKLFQWQSPDYKMRMYLEELMVRSENAKELILFNTGKLLLKRYKSIFTKHYIDTLSLEKRKCFWGAILSMLSSISIYSCFSYVIYSTINSTISIGEMAMFLMLIKQGQMAVSEMFSSIGMMYENNLYLSNYRQFLLLKPSSTDDGIAVEVEERNVSKIDKKGVYFKGVYFKYPGEDDYTLKDLTFQLNYRESIAFVGSNGSGKTTLLKLLCGLYKPTKGDIYIDGVSVSQWDQTLLRKKVGIIFQDFIKYQLLVGENVGAGDINEFSNEVKWKEAAKIGQADRFITELKSGYKTQLGRWFKNGSELSGGQWQKIALSRAFFRTEADILVLDEPTSALDPEAEEAVFLQFKKHCENNMGIVISHRFSTVRMADNIIVLESGKVKEMGTHDSLMTLSGRYSELFTLQAKGYS